MKKQVVMIHGGSTYDSYEEYIANLKTFELTEADLHKKRWKHALESELGAAYDVVMPLMPNPNNAKYNEWKIWFEKHIPFLVDDLIFIGHSLGGIFFAKYLSENDFPKKIHATILVAAPFDGEGVGTLADFPLPDTLSRLEKQGGQIILYQSKDDKVVPFEAVTKYKKALPSAVVREFDAYGHFSVPEFPELIEEIKNLK